MAGAGVGRGRVMETSPTIEQKNDSRGGRRLLSERAYRNLSRTLMMPEVELRQLLNLEPHMISVPAGRRLHEEGEANRTKILVSGWACQQSILEDGRRQIFSFVVPGDPFNYHQASTHVNLVALTNMVLFDATALEQAARKPGAHLALVGYFAKMEKKRIGFLYSHILRLGSETAYERLRSLLAELFERLSQAGLSHNDGVQLPLTQETLADSLGISVVHINRVLQQMRRDGVVTLEDGRLLLGTELEKMP